MYSESDTRSKFIDPMLYAQGREESQITRERYFTDGRKLPGGKRGKRSFVDYLLKDYGINLAIVEAKKYGLPPTEGLEQVKEYGKKLGVRWVYSTNGQEIYEWDRDAGIGNLIAAFPSPSDLYERYTDEYATIRQQILSIPYYIDSSKRPRYYQDLAITRALSAIAAGEERILLTLATGTGKTYIAFQIAYKLLQARWSKHGFNRRPRILFLADRNILIEQAINTFNPLEKDCKWIRGKEIKRALGKVPTNANIFFAIYQAIIAGEDQELDTFSAEELLDAVDSSQDLLKTEEVGGYYRQYEPDFFDLIIIDECHRGGAKEEGNWAEILKYFASAIQIGMTATPKRDDNINTYEYFGQPVYEYSLKEGINDGFLTPYKVKRIQTNIDELVIDSDVEILGGDQTKEFYEIKDFAKKYSKAWQITLEVIFHSLYRIDQLLLTSKAEIITSCPSGMLIKCEFTVAGSNISAHASGNRYIIYQDQQTKVISILLLYAKTHVRKNQQETIRRKQEIKSNYPFIKNLFPEL